MADLHESDNPRIKGCLKSRANAKRTECGIGFTNWALLCEHQGEYAKAESFYVWALSIWEKAGVGADHSEVAVCRKNYGVLLAKMQGSTKGGILGKLISVWRDFCAGFREGFSNRR
jgi:hypothetical protein